METLKKIYFFVLLIPVLFNNVHAAPIDGNSVYLHVLDKVTSRVEIIEIPVGEIFEFGSLQIEIFLCKKRPPEEIPEDFVLLRVYDKISPENSEIIFQGWMISSSPAVTPFEHPIYDVWVKDCKIDIESE
mgnify:FL=1